MSARPYLELTKPRLLPAVLFSALPVLLMAGPDPVAPTLMVMTLIGTALAAGAMAIAAEVFGILLSGFGIMNILGLVAGVLAIIAAKSYTEGGSEPEPA